MNTTKWTLDPTHSEIGFKVKHMMITNVSGKFNQFQVNVETQGNDFTTANISFEAATASIDAGNEQRNGHLISPDFFDSENYPSMKFENGKLNKKGEDTYTLTGDLTIKTISHPVELAVEMGGIGNDPGEIQKQGFLSPEKINRKDWKLDWNATLATGGLLLSEEIKIVAEIQLLQQVAAAEEVVA